VKSFRSIVNFCLILAVAWQTFVPCCACAALPSSKIFQFFAPKSQTKSVCLCCKCDGPRDSQKPLPTGDGHQRCPKGLFCGVESATTEARPTTLKLCLFEAAELPGIQLAALIAEFPVKALRCPLHDGQRSVILSMQGKLRL
jgi:hypothetical protein